MKGLHTKKQKVHIVLQERKKTHTSTHTHSSHSENEEFGDRKREKTAVVSLRVARQ